MRACRVTVLWVHRSRLCNVRPYGASASTLLVALELSDERSTIYRGRAAPNPLRSNTVAGQTGPYSDAHRREGCARERARTDVPLALSANASPSGSSSISFLRRTSAAHPLPPLFRFSALAARYRHDVTELRTKIEGNGSHCSSRISSLSLLSPSAAVPVHFFVLFLFFPSISRPVSPPPRIHAFHNVSRAPAESAAAASPLLAPGRIILIATTRLGPCTVGEGEVTGDRRAVGAPEFVACLPPMIAARARRISSD